MKNKHFILIRILVWLIPIGIFFAITYNYFSLDGHFHLVYDFDKPSGYVSRFYSPDNYKVKDQDNDVWIEIFKTPTAFNLKVPVKFETGKVKLTFKSENIEKFQFGVIEDEGRKNFRLQDIQIEHTGSQTKEVELDLHNIYYHPEDKLGYVFIIDQGDLNITKMEFDLYRDNLWQTLSKKLNRAQD